MQLKMALHSTTQNVHYMGINAQLKKLIAVINTK